VIENLSRIKASLGGTFAQLAGDAGIAQH